MRTFFRRAKLAIKFVFCWRLAVLLAATQAVYGQRPGPSGFLRTAPQPLADSEPLVEALPPTDDIRSLAQLASALNLPGVEAGYMARASVIIDSTRLADFAKGTFMPAAIPVEGESFFEFGERATVQGNGSAVQISASGKTSYAANYSTAARFVVTDASTGGLSGQFGQAFVQYEQLVLGITESAFADPDALLPTVDLAGPNAIATVLSPVGGGGQGRLSSYMYLSGDPEQGFIGNVSIEQPTPEIQFTGGDTPATTYSRFAHFPDLILTLKYSDGQRIAPQCTPRYDELWHLQLGSLVRDLAIKNGNKTIDDAALGWGFQLSGFRQTNLSSGNLSDGIGFSIIYGEGIGHYVNDLHFVATDRPIGGNDAILVGDHVEPLPAFAYYVAYLHNWSNCWQSTFGYSQVDLDSVPGLAPTAYQRGSYAAVNLLYHLANEAPKPTFSNFFAGIEYLFGQKEEVNGNTGDAHRFMFIVSLIK